MSNLYYSPEKFGLTPVAEIDYYQDDYGFDLRVAWKHTSGALYTARDSGCSCPSPFEDYGSIEELERVTYDSLEAIVRSEAARSEEARDFLAKVAKAME